MTHVFPQDSILRFPSPGDLFEDRYLIQSVLGSGGFARVYRATEQGLDRDVALKILRPPTYEDQSDSQRDDYMETLIQRFRREAMLLSKLRSPYTITMYHYGTSVDGLLFMALEFIDGESLAELGRRHLPQPPERVVTILSQVLESLHEAHSMGMLHRDLKPANIMLYEHLGVPDKVKLLDFGIAKTLNDSARKDLTSDGTLIGTPRYMAPEQIQGDASSVGPAADVYALGLVGYELLVGQKAVQGDNSIQIIGNQLGTISYELPFELDVPPKLREVINKMMEKNQDDRFSTCIEVLEEFADPDLLLPSIDIAADSLEELTDLDRDAPDRALPIPLPAILVIGASLVLALLVSFSFLTGEDENEVQAEETQIVQEVVKVEAVEDLPVESVPTLVASNMQGVEILMNGELIGKAPIEVLPEELPARITARWRGSEKTATLTESMTSLVIPFAPEDDKTKKEPKKVSKPKKTARRVTKTPKKTPKKPDKIKYFPLE